MRYPTVFYDEMVYLGVARFFAGAGHMPNLYGGAWGHLGYSAIIAPAYWLSHEFRYQYRAILVINAVLMTCSYPLLYLVLKRFSAKTGWLAANAATASIYPSFLLFSNFAISENVFVPLFLLVLLLWLRFLERPAAARAVAVGLSILAVYLVHNRGVSVVIVSIGFTLILSWLRRVPWRSGAIVAGMGAGTLILVALLKRFLEANWPPTLFPQADLSLIATPDGAIRFLAVCLGQFVYLTGSTFGLYVAGIEFFVSSCLPGRKRFAQASAATEDIAGNPKVNRDAAIFLLTIHACVFIGSAAFVSVYDEGSTIRADYILMGRYNEGLLPVFLGAGLLLLVNAAKLPQATYLLRTCAGMSLAILAAGALLLQPVIDWQWLQGPATRINFLALMPFIRAVHRDSLAAILAIPAAVMVLTMVASALRRPGAALLTIALLFAGGAGFYVSQDLRAVQNMASYDPSTGSVTRMRSLLEASRIEGPVDVETAVWSPFYFSHWQLYSANRVFRLFHGPTGMKTIGRLVIAQKDWRGAETGYHFAGCEDDQSACLWIR